MPTFEQRLGTAINHHALEVRRLGLRYAELWHESKEPAGAAAVIDINRVIYSLTRLVKESRSDRPFQWNTVQQAIDTLEKLLK